MGKLTKDIQAFTIVEALVALIIVSISLSLSLSLYLKIVESDKAKVIQKADSLLEEELENTLKNEVYKNKTYTKDNLKLIKQVKSFQGNPNLLLIDIRIKNSEEEVILDRHTLISANS